MQLLFDPGPILLIFGFMTCAAFSFLVIVCFFYFPAVSNHEHRIESVLRPPLACSRRLIFSK